ncbi:MAG: ketopantoate reductase family protein [Vulcanimicrobiaceae bacterium]
MRIAIVGAGGIGGFLAAALARAGFNVGVVARGAHLDAIQAHGLRVGSSLGAFVVHVKASDRLSELGARDLLLLTFKAHQWPALLPQIAQAARAGAILVTLQNGVPFWFTGGPALESVDPGGRIGDALAGARILGGVVHLSGRLLSPGVVEQSGGLRYVLGDPDGTRGGDAQAVVELFRSAGLEPELDANIRRPVWGKLVNNVGLNPTSALTRATIAPMLADSSVREIVAGLMGEALAVGRALGVASLDDDVQTRMGYAARLNDVRTSMLQDIEAGRKTELDPILGAVLELATRCRIDTPLIRTIYALTRQLEQSVLGMQAGQADRLAR